MSLFVNRIQALCFDVDGTLRDTDDQFVAKLAKLLKPFKSILPGHDSLAIARRFVMRLESPATYLYGVPDRLNFDYHLVKIGEYLHRIGSVEEDHPIIDGVQETLKQLNTNYPMSIVSNRSERSTRAFLDAYDLNFYFQCVVTGQTCRNNKPHPEPLLWAADQMGVPAARCLMIGDTTVDMLVGKATGAQTVGVLCGFGEEEELRENGADLILDGPIELVNVLLDENGETGYGLVSCG